MNHKQFQLYEKLREKFGAESMDTLIEFLDTYYNHTQYVTKQDLEEAVALLESQIAVLKSETDAKFAQQDAKIEKSKNEIIRWLIGFLAPLYIGMIGIIIKLFS